MGFPTSIATDIRPFRFLMKQGSVSLSRVSSRGFPTKYDSRKPPPQAEVAGVVRRWRI